MKALAVFPSSREVRLIDQPEPMIAGPTEVKLRILEAGICGTDREITSFHYGTPPVNSRHLIIGHEALGEVIDVGSGVIGLAPSNGKIDFPNQFLSIYRSTNLSYISLFFLSFCSKGDRNSADVTVMCSLS